MGAKGTRGLQSGFPAPFMSLPQVLPQQSSFPHPDLCPLWQGHFRVLGPLGIRPPNEMPPRLLPPIDPGQWSPALAAPGDLPPGLLSCA